MRLSQHFAAQHKISTNRELNQQKDVAEKACVSTLAENLAMAGREKFHGQPLKRKYFGPIQPKKDIHEAVHNVVHLSAPSSFPTGGTTNKKKNFNLQRL